MTVTSGNGSKAAGMPIGKKKRNSCCPCPLSLSSLSSGPPDLSVGNDYLVSDGMNKYSVPYALIGKKVNLRLTPNTVEVFFRGNRVAIHVPRQSVTRSISASEYQTSGPSTGILTCFCGWVITNKIPPAATGQLCLGGDRWYFSWY